MTQAVRQALLVSVAWGLGLLFVLAPGQVSAHAQLLIASPAAGTGLPQAPASVVIKFSEPLDLGLSRIDVFDANGRDVGAGPTISVPGDPDAMQRRVGDLPIERYRVAWTSVSLVDGHVLRGSYGFAVGTTAEPGASVSDSPLDTEGWLGLAGRFSAIVGLVLWAGSALLTGIAARAGVPASALRGVAIGAPATAALGSLLSIVSTALVTNGSLAGLGLVVASGSGPLRAAGILIATAGAAAAYANPRDAALPFGRAVSILLVAGAILAEVASGHASVATPAPLAVALFAIHLVAAGAWTFAIGAALLAGRRMGESLAAFTPWAVAAAAAIALTGAFNAWLSLASPTQLIDSGYGLTLVAKTAAFAAMAGLGATHWLRRRAAARKQPESAALRAPARGELVAAVLALALASLLAGFPNPPREQGSAPAFATIDPTLARLAGRPAASVAGASGPFVVGLTILPPRPGRVEMRVQVLGLAAGDGPRDAMVVAVSPRGVASTTDLAACGLGCFAGRGSLAETGRWALGVRIATNRGAITVDMALPLPTADGTSVLRTAQAAIGRLRSARLHETLGSEVGGPQITSDYAFTAPDAMRVVVGETSRIIIGSSEWQRSSAQAAWEQTTWPGTPFAWPSAYFSALWGQPVAVRVVGQEVVDGHPSTIVAFLRADIPAWFRLWVGDDGLVRRQEMRAEAHLMDHTLTDLNAPITITPPS